MKRFGFTLAEVLITLVIIGVIAAMTIPTLMNNTNQQEFRVGLKKAISALNQAMSLNYALEGTTVGDTGLTDATNIRDNLFKKRMSIVSTATTGAAIANADSSAPDVNGIMYTADGMRFALSGVSASGTDSAADGEKYYGYIIIDVNGEKGPNVATTSSAYPRDTYIVTMFGNRVVAGKIGETGTNSTSVATREVLFDKQ